MYTLTLTLAERKAIDWVGHRYANGDSLYQALWAESTASPDDADWDDERPITFAIPEHVAWRIAEIHDEEHGWPCFADELCDKLDTLLASIV